MQVDFDMMVEMAGLIDIFVRMRMAFGRLRIAFFAVAILLIAIPVLLPLSSCASSQDEADQSIAVESSSSPQSELLPAEKVNRLQPAERVDDLAADGSMASSSASESVDGLPSRSELIVRFIDVGQGDCALISCNNHHLLIDGGSPSESSKVYAILERLNIAHLDFIIATHPDADHIGGISGALSFATCGVCFCSIDESDTETFNAMRRYLNRRGIGITIPSVGDSFMLGEARVTFVGPTQKLYETNNNSLVCRIDFGDTSFLFTGDAEYEEESLLVSHNADLKANVLKVAHHGSASSSTPSFLSKVDPDYAVISVGQGNSYGHPTSEVLDRLASIGAVTIRTDQLGSIIFHSDGSVLSYETTKGMINE